MKTEKKCSNCFQVKPVEEFYKRKTHDGFQSRCKACNHEVVKGWKMRSRLNDRDRYLNRELR